VWLVGDAVSELDLEREHRFRPASTVGALDDVADTTGLRLAESRRHVSAILERLRNGTMPCEGAWPSEKVIDVSALDRLRDDQVGPAASAAVGPATWTLLQTRSAPG